MQSNFSLNISCLIPKINTKTISSSDKIAELNVSMTNIMEVFNYSIIEGEYIECELIESDIDNFIVQLEKFGDDLNQESTDDDDLELSHFVINTYIWSLKIASRAYKRLILKQRKKIESPNDLDLLYTIPTINTAIEFEILQHNILLSHVDLFFELTNDNLRDLYRIKDFIQKSNKGNSNEILNILSDKCMFLISKFKIKYDNHKFIQKYFYAFGESEGTVDTNSFEYNYEAFRKLDEKSKEYCDWKNGDEISMVRSMREFHEFNKHTTYSYEELYRKVRFYKEIEKDIKKIDDIIYNIKSSKEESLKFNKRANEISLNYFYNNRTAFIVENSPNVSKIKEDIKAIDNLQNETNVRNFYPYLKYSYFCEKYLELKLSSAASYNEAIDEIDDVMTIFENSLLKLEENFIWSEVHCFLPFQPLFEECCIKDHSILNRKIFISSSFVVPVDYKSIESKYKQLCNNLQRFKIVVSVFKSTNDFFIMDSKIKSIKISTKDALKGFSDKEEINRKEIQKELKTLQYSNIQIVAIFACLVLFTSANIQLFTKATNYKDAIMFMIAFSGCLFVFSLLLWETLKAKECSDNKFGSFFSKHIFRISVCFTTMVLVIYLTSASIRVLFDYITECIKSFF